jgi:glycosyltransferase involved in cell wall biosynthesis
MLLKHKPRVSVIIPAFNSAVYIHETIESVKRQTYKDYEIIVIDDGSTDDTRDIVKAYGDTVTYYYQSNKGAGVPRNIGVRMSNGEYIAFLDHDDIWLPDKLNIQVSVMDADPGLSFVCSETYVFTDKEGTIDLWRKPRWAEESFAHLLEDNFISVLTVLMRRSCFDEIGGFDERLHANQDYDLWLRMTANNHRFKYINIPLARYRRHKYSFARNTEKKIESYKLLLGKKEIWRRMPFFKRFRRLSGIYYDFAERYLSSRQYAVAMKYYIKSAWFCPAAGYYAFAGNEKQSVIYKIFRVYYLIFKCGFKAVFNKRKRENE